MKYNGRSYEDEIDRMRARRQRQRPVQAKRREEDFEIEDLNRVHMRKTNRHGNTNVHYTANKRRKHKKTKFYLCFFVAFLILFGIFLFRKSRDDGYWTIVIYGVDSRDGNLGRGALADVQILCSINKKTGEIRLASVFRDTYLKIDPEGNYNKINEAYFLGGREQAGEALKENLDLHIEDYATFNWKAIADGINVLGGIDLEITDKEFAYINSFITETVESTGVGSVHLEHSGMNHLDGVQAVAYARLRLMDTDFNRTERQRKVLGLAMEKAKNADFNTLKTLVGAVFPQISTSIGVDDVLLMAKNVKKYYIGQTSGFPFSHSERMIGKKDCVIPTTLESNVIQLHAFLYDDTQFTPSGVVKIISARIAEDSGLSEPGKDIESGKNVGAEGSNSNGQVPASQENQNQDTPQQTAELQTPDNETEMSENQQTGATESNDFESTEEETFANENSDENFPAQTIPSNDDNPSNDRNDNPTTNPGPGGYPEEGNNNGPVSAPGASDDHKDETVGPGAQAPTGPTGQPNGILEGPGQN